ncbi:MAG TPA: hypothetical protein PKY81_16085 [bacterium]|nr:hypothetical protein [bacterium]
MKVNYTIYNDDCLKWLKKYNKSDIALTFLDPPFNQDKEYRYFNDSLTDSEYWGFMKNILSQLYRITEIGGSIYFMQREKIRNMF